MKVNQTMAGNQMELEVEIHHSEAGSSDDDLGLDLRGLNDLDLRGVDDPDAEKSGYDYVETARTSESGDYNMDNDTYEGDVEPDLPLDLSDPSSVRRSLGFIEKAKVKNGSQSACTFVSFEISSR